MNWYCEAGLYGSIHERGGPRVVHHMGTQHILERVQIRLLAQAYSWDLDVSPAWARSTDPGALLAKAGGLGRGMHLA